MSRLAIRTDLDRYLEEARRRGERWGAGRRDCGYRQTLFSLDDAARLVRDLVVDLSSVDADDVVWAVAEAAARAYQVTTRGAA